jgi:DNA-binding cell septation regulator SpoVG
MPVRSSISNNRTKSHSEEESMLKIEVQSVSGSHRSNVLAQAVVTLSDSDSFITINDIRVLQNRQGQQWVALPSFAVSKGGKDFSYLPTIELTASLTRELTTRVLEAYEQWNAGGRR